MSVKPALQLDTICRDYQTGAGVLKVFENLDLEVFPGQITALVGPSGAGKSSLLHIAGLLETPSSGDVIIAGQACGALDDAARTRIRRFAIGFVYQFHHLLPEFSALENVIMPQLIAATPREDAKKRAEHLLTRLGLAERLDHRPAELSGGEQQRVAIARALANKPLLLVADEPTGNLDPHTAETVHDQFMQLISEEGLAALIATHNIDMANRMNRVVQLENGRLVEGGS